MRTRLSPDQLGARVLVVCAAVLFMALGGAMAVESWQHRSTEAIERDHRGQGQLTVLVDATDPLSQGQVLQLEGQLQRVVEMQLQPGDVVTIWILGQSVDGPLRRVLRLHVPPTESNPLYQNPHQVAGHYDAQFTRPMHGALTGLSAAAPARWSPILESINTLAELPDLHGSSRCRLVLASDLEQHSHLASFLSRQPTFAAYHRTGASGALPDLHRVSVEIVVIPRAGQDLQTELSRERFWTEYLRAAGAARVVVERL
jgi:hypothetical protein